MRVALYDPRTSGHHPEYAAHIVEYLSKMGDEVLYITPDQSERTTVVEDAGAEIKHVGHIPTGNAIKSFPRTISNVRSGIKVATDWNSEIFHHLFVDTREPAITMALSTSSIPSVFTLFNPHYNREGSTIQRVYGALCLNSVDLFCNKKSFRGMFVHTLQIKQCICQESQFLRSGDLHVIPDPVKPPDNRLSKESARRKLNINDTEPIYLFFGGLRAEKGPKLLLNMIENLDQDATFVIAGTEGAVGQKEVDETNYQSRATIDARLKFIPDSDIYTYFFACDAVLLPYRSDYTGTSGVLQRAAAARRPVIATDVGEVGPIVKEYKLGHVVQPDTHSLSKQLESFDPQNGLDKFEPSLHEYAKDHSVQRFVRKVRTVYTNALA